MFVSATTYEKFCLVKLAMSIIGVSLQGRVRSNDPLVFALFVDTFNVFTQEEIRPIMLSVAKIEYDTAIETVSALSEELQNELQYYLLKISGDDFGLLAHTSLLIKRIKGVDSNIME